ncbi:MAG: hypothetical protein VB013_04740 [Anaerolineaceae bacterium]|nr:hypothetical protein [Anaerolineaceae bacterium]
MQSIPPARPLPKQPIPVWAGLFLVLAMFNCGASIIASLFILLKPSALASAGVSIWNYLFSVLLSIAIIVFAILAWKGNRRAKNTFLVLYCVFLGLIAINNLLGAFGLINGADIANSWMRVVRNLFLLGWYLYYFNRDAPKMYFSD